MNRFRISKSFPRGLVVFLLLPTFFIACSGKKAPPKPEKSDYTLMMEMVASLDDSNAMKDYLRAALIVEKDFSAEAKAELEKFMKDGWSDDFTELAKFMDESGALEIVREGIKKDSCLKPLDPENDDFYEAFPHLSAFRALGNMLTISAQRREGEGDFEAAMDSYLEALAFGQDISRGGSLTDKLVSVGVCCTTLWNIERAYPVLENERNLEELIAATEALERRMVPAWEVFERELALTRNATEEFLSDFLMTLISTEDRPVKERIRRIAKAPFIKEELLEKYDKAVVLALEASKKSYPEFQKEAELLEPKWDLVYYDWPVLDKAVESFVREVAFFRGIRLMAAVRLYKIRNGKYPETLESLVPGLIDEIPIDPFDDKPFRYAIIDGTPVVYSVGSNLIDEGGKVEIDWREKTGDFSFRCAE